MNYNDNGTVKQITVKAGDTLPVGTEVDVPDGTTIPAGWVEVPNPNLFDGTTMVSGKGLNGTTGQPYEVASRSYYEYMEVEAYTTYVLADITPASICFYNSTETFISSVSGATIFTTPADTYYVRVAFNSTVPYSSASLKKRKIEDTKRIRKTYNGVVPNGKILNSYSDSVNDTYSCDYINDKIVNVGLTSNSDFKTNIIHSRNLFDINKRIYTAQALNSVSVSLSNGVLTANISSGTAHSAYAIPVEVGKQYTIKWTNATGFNSVQCTDGTTQYFRSYNTSDTQTITATSSVLLINLLASGTSLTITNFQVEIGTTSTAYQEYVSPAIVVDGDEIYNKSSLEYSIEEQRIGTWIDGKPLYRKVIQTTTNSSTAEQRTIIAYSILNIIKLDGRIEFATNSTLPLNTYSDASNYVHTYTNVYNGNTRVITATTYTSKPITYIVEYTKTTD